MKKILLPLLCACLLLVACSPKLYQQIATLSSDSVTLNDEGYFAYEDAIITVEYDFWSEAGKFVFTVTNNTDDDIWLDLSRSYFVNNGYAYDYYQARTYISTSRNLSSTRLNSSVAKTLESGTSIEYEEKPAVCIPAHASKVFQEFDVSSSVFRECGFARDPSKRELSVREFTGYNSPRIIENRLTFKIGEVVLPVVNVFYVSSYQNISCANTVEYRKTATCNGSILHVKEHKLSAPNKFYITYDPLAPSEAGNDRTTASFRIF
ncbi:MAG: hypothetical protein K2O58_02160 [Bacteroidales bacterium]|nr:hypothetical protein [Bacteroidales bacterium]